MTEQEFLDGVNALGGSLYIVGGWVRDLLRGVAPKDKDYVVCGLKEEAFQTRFGDAVKVGAAFPVYLLLVDGRKCEVAFARKEKKSGTGYRGFDIQFDETIAIEEDLYRRDTTMNSMAYDLRNGRIIDPYGGAEAVRRREIRATSPHFSEDPVRALRAARQSAELGFSISGETLDVMRSCGAELALEAPERLVAELNRALGTDQPSTFFYALQCADLLRVVFPELFALIGQMQPAEHHPEGDAFVHTMQVVDRAAKLCERVEVRFAALVHDLGKGLTPKELLPHHYGHEETGIAVLKKWNRRMTLPQRWMKCAAFAIAAHMRVHVMKRPGKIVDFMVKLAANPIGADGFRAVVCADSGETPEFLRNFASYWKALRKIRGGLAPEGLVGAAVGSWIRQERIRSFKAMRRKNEIYE